MRAHLRQLFEDLNESFWVRPSLIVVGGMVAAEVMINAERWDVVPSGVLAAWLYSGGETGARTLLGAVAGSTIGVAGTVFSITIATLTLASNQMGPRLLRNFTRDRGNQATLGIYLGTFAYALIVLRSVRGTDQGAFVPHLAITGAIVLALLCVAMLIFFVNHVASRINFDTVIEIVYRDLCRALTHIKQPEGQCDRMSEEVWSGGQSLTYDGTGYIQQLDEESLADWAENNNVSIRLHARAGDFVFPGAPLATTIPHGVGAQKAIADALVLGAYPTQSGDLEYTIDQLVDIAVRALSPGINDPRTANRILDRLGAALCVLSGKSLPTGAIRRKGRLVFQRDATTYSGLTDAMFHTLRQSAKGNSSTLIHLADILVRVAQCEKETERRQALHRHGSLVMADGERTIENPDDRAELHDRATVLLRALAPVNAS
jgi:uncharacterized membrane protein